MEDILIISGVSIVCLIVGVIVFNMLEYWSESRSDRYRYGHIEEHMQPISNMGRVEIPPCIAPVKHIYIIDGVKHEFDTPPRVVRLQHGFVVEWGKEFIEARSVLTYPRFNQNRVKRRIVDHDSVYQEFSDGKRVRIKQIKQSCIKI